MKTIDGFVDKNKKRVIGLDIVRSVAILLVIYEHGAWLLPAQVKNVYNSMRPFLDGVNVFFVLSGFLIGGILIKIIQQTDFVLRDLLDFWLRRWFRTIPNYFFVLFCLLIYHYVMLGNLGEFNWKYLFFLQNFNWAIPSFFPETWSLSVEEWFYLLFPLICFLLIRIVEKKKNAIIIATFLFILIPLALRIYKYCNGIGLDSWDANYRIVVLCRLDSLMFGIIAAYLNFFRTAEWLKFKTLGLLISGLLVVYLTVYSRLFPNDQVFFAIYRYNLESLVTFFALPFFSQLISIKSKYLSAFFTIVSMISYSMYLLNFTPIIKHAIPITLSVLGLENSDYKYLYVFNYFMYVFYVFFLSYFLYRFFEHPMTMLRDKIKLKQTVS